MYLEEILHAIDVVFCCINFDIANFVHLLIGYSTRARQFSDLLTEDEARGQ